MSDDLISIIGCCIIGMLAHAAHKHHWLEWVLRVTYGLFLFGEIINLVAEPQSVVESPWTYTIMFGTTLTTGILLFKPGRKMLSLFFTCVNQIVAGRLFLACLGKLEGPLPISPAKTMNSDTALAVLQEQALAVAAEPAEVPVLQKLSIGQSLLAERIFVAESIPHMNALWIYVTCMAWLLTHTEPAGFQMPSIMIPTPVTLDQLFSYNFLGLVLLAFCGTGIFVSRKPLAVLRRLGLVKPTFTQVLIGVAGIFVTFAYDYVWSTYTHSQEGLGYADKLSHYNEGTFTSGASPGPAFLVASATGLCAGLGEETLIRGALQPVFGIVPAAFMHGALHGQFAHAPLLIMQVFGWSMMMGILRRYTNTTTTIITHVGFNFLSTFIIAFNP